jgi:hypothetical protein
VPRLAGTVEQQGQGIGAVFTVITLQATGQSTTESGTVLFDGSTAGCTRDDSLFATCPCCRAVGNIASDRFGAEGENCS